MFAMIENQVLKNVLAFILTDDVLETHLLCFVFSDFNQRLLFWLQNKSFFLSFFPLFLFLLLLLWVLKSIYLITDIVEEHSIFFYCIVLQIIDITLGYLLLIGSQDCESNQLFNSHTSLKSLKTNLRPNT